MLFSLAFNKASAKESANFVWIVWYNVNIYSSSMFHWENHYIAFFCLAEVLAIEMRYSNKSKAGLCNMSEEWRKLIFQVSEVYNLHRESFYLAVDYIDRYLSSTSNIHKTRLQLVGVTALFIAAKLEVSATSLHCYIQVKASGAPKASYLLAANAEGARPNLFF